MSEMELLLDPKSQEFNEEKLFESITELRSKLKTTKTSASLFTLVIDSFKKNGKICEVLEKDNENIIFEFKFAD